MIKIIINTTLLFYVSALVIIAGSDINEFLIIGHRGAAGHAPENTIVSIKLAEELGANAVEIDIRQTKDGIPVALHDSGIDRTTNGCGDISELTYDELKKLDAGSWFNSKYRNVRIPSLEEIVISLSETTILIIEFKGGLGEYEGIEERALDIIKKYDISERVILKSFDPNQLEKIKSLDPDIPLLYVYAVRIPWLNIIIDTGVTFGCVFEFDTEYLQPHEWFLSGSFVKEADSRGRKVIAWGVNDIDEIKEAIDEGVNGIETDYPEKVFNYIQDKRHKIKDKRHKIKDKSMSAG